MYRKGNMEKTNINKLLHEVTISTVKKNNYKF